MFHVCCADICFIRSGPVVKSKRILDHCFIPSIHTARGKCVARKPGASAFRIITLGGIQLDSPIRVAKGQQYEVEETSTVITAAYIYYTDNNRHVNNYNKYNSMCVCVCLLPIDSGHQVRWTYQPGSHRRKVT